MYRKIVSESGPNSGGVVLCVVVCAASLILLAGAIVALLQTFQTNKEDDHRKAVALAEYGLQSAFKELALSKEWDAGFTDQPLDEGEGGSFGVVITREVRDGTLFLKIVSTGTSGSTTQVRECTLRLEVSEDGDSTWVNEGIR